MQRSTRLHGSLRLFDLVLKRVPSKKGSFACHHAECKQGSTPRQLSTRHGAQQVLQCDVHELVETCWITVDRGCYLFFKGCQNLAFPHPFPRHYKPAHMANFYKRKTDWSLCVLRTLSGTSSNFVLSRRNKQEANEHSDSPLL